jgi:hypothetical protein
MKMKMKLYDVGPKVTLEQVIEIEKTIGHQLPQQYKDFLLQFNGGEVSPDCFKVKYSGQEWAEGLEEALLRAFYSIPEHEYYSFLENQEFYEGRVPADTILIADTPGRDKILLGIEGENTGKIFYWNGSYEVDEEEQAEEGFQADYSNVGFVANSFNEFLKGLYIMKGDDDDNEYEADGEYEIN